MIARGSLSQKDLRKAKKRNSSLPCLYQAQKRAESLTPWYKKKGQKDSCATVTTNVCACSVELQGRVLKVLI